MRLVDYLRPIGVQRTTTYVSNSKFICSVSPVDSTADARNFIEQIRQEMSGASHHPYAFRVGYANSVTEGMSDDGEPSGTAGPPILAVLRGTAIGDIIVVVTRYFGGTKLGTGGLVRAYTEAAQVSLNVLKTEYKIARNTLGIELPYPFYDKVLRLVQKYNGEIEDEAFAGNVTLMFKMPQEFIAEFQRALAETTSGQIAAILFD
jgi:uncharacterized YigZ family protein